MLDDDRGDAGLAGDRLRHAEHDRRRIDDAELERELLDETRHLTEGDELLDPTTQRRIIQHRTLIDRADLAFAHDLSRVHPYGAALEGERRFTEDQYLLLNTGQQLR